MNEMITGRRFLKAMVAWVTVLSSVLPFGVSWSAGITRPAVTVKAASRVKGEKVYLADLAVIHADNALKECLSKICLGLSPRPGKSVEWCGDWIASRVRANRAFPKNAVVQAPEVVRVVRSWQHLDEEDLLRRYKGFVAQHLKDQKTDFRVARFRVSGNGPIPEGRVRVTLSGPPNSRFMGHMSLSAVVRVDGKVVRRLGLSGWVDRFENVVCTLRRLNRHAMVTDKDVCLEKRNISRLPGNVARSLDSVVGKRLKHAVRANAVLMANAVEEPPLIQKGDRVKIVAESAALKITALGIAQGPGAAGDRIRVRNVMNKKVIVASVVDRSTVRVEF
ncbi:MAG: flagellar basal body P-ring formation protein FlgA [Deltaproteobacteria bacterium]|nr:flagellar basal body P-ring formation protein FlgA [Deltaproteobacteria bacterium]